MVNGRILRNGDVNYYRFRVYTAGTVAIVLESPANISFFLNDGRNIINPETIYAGRHLIIRDLAPGEYYIGVSGNVGNYQLQVMGNGVERRPTNDRYFVITRGIENLIVRESPSTSTRELARLAPGTKVKIVMPMTTHKEDSSNITFIKIYYDGNKTGWVSSALLWPDRPIEFIPPETVSYTHNGIIRIFNTQNSWPMPGNGGYTGQPLKSNGRYRVAVGPKILHPDYPDNGRILRDDFSGFNKNITVVLEHIQTGKQLRLLCVVVDFKAHSFNRYSVPGNSVNYDIESGYMQTGIRYPNASNPLAFAPNNMDGSLIEFCTDAATLAADINVSDYRLIKIIALEE